MLSQLRAELGLERVELWLEDASGKLRLAGCSSNRAMDELDRLSFTLALAPGQGLVGRVVEGTEPHGVQHAARRMHPRRRAAARQAGLGDAFGVRVQHDRVCGCLLLFLPSRAASPERREKDVHVRARLRVLVVDDQPLTLKAVARCLRRSGLRVIGAVATAAEALELVIADEPDVVLMDVVLADESGVGATIRLLEARPSTKVIAYTGLYGSAVADAMAVAGAIAIVRKSIAPALIAPAITALVHGNELAETMTPFVELIDHKPRLSPRHLQVLMHLGLGATSKEIGGALDLSPRTVEKHRNSISKILGISGAAALAAWAVRAGLVS